MSFLKWLLSSLLIILLILFVFRIGIQIINILLVITAFSFIIDFLINRRKTKT